MLRIIAESSRLCDGLTRREVLRFGGLAGLGLAGLSGGPATALPAPGFGKAKSLLFISLFGGPSHQDIWDMKPNAPAEVRGEFKPIPTNVAGIQITEHLPKLAQLADRYSLVRSVTHADNGHGSAMYAGFTGWPHPLPNTNPIPNADDYPAYGASVGYLRPPPSTIPGFICVGGAQIVCGNQIPGQRAGFLGPSHEPFVVKGDPSQKDFRVPELSLPEGIPSLRLDRRRSLLSEVDRASRSADSAPSAALDASRRRAFDLLASERVRAALDLTPETAALRDRFGRDRFGQSLILARRLIEVGVPARPSTGPPAGAGTPTAATSRA
jgi:hypothetical protein